MAPAFINPCTATCLQVFYCFSMADIYQNVFYYFLLHGPFSNFEHLHLCVLLIMTSGIHRLVFSILGDFSLGPSPKTTPANFNSTSIPLIPVYRTAGGTRITVSRLPIRRKSVHRHFCLRFKMSGKCAKTLSLHDGVILNESTALLIEAVCLSPTLHTPFWGLQRWAPTMVWTNSCPTYRFLVFAF